MRSLAATLTQIRDPLREIFPRGLFLQSLPKLWILFIKVVFRRGAVLVRVERRYMHPLFKKTVRHTKKYYAHDEKNEFKVGDIVWIEEHRPISKLKRWAVVRGEKRQTSP